MAFNDPTQPSVLVNPLPFISGVQDPTVIPRAAASYDAVAQGALQARAIGEPFSPKADAETQAAIAEANQRRKDAQDEDMQNLKKILTVAQTAKAQASIKDMEDGEANRLLKQRAETASLINALGSSEFSADKDALAKEQARRSYAGQKADPKRPDGTLDTDLIQREAGEIGQWLDYTTQAAQASLHTNYKDDAVEGAAGTVQRNMRLDVGRETLNGERQALVKLSKMPLAEYQVQKAKGILPSIQLPLFGAPGKSVTATQPTGSQPAPSKVSQTIGKDGVLTSTFSDGSTQVTKPKGPVDSTVNWPDGGTTVTLEDGTSYFVPAFSAAPAAPAAPADSASGGTVGPDGILRDAQGRVVIKRLEDKSATQTESRSKAGDYHNRMSNAEFMYNQIINDDFDPAGPRAAAEFHALYPNPLRTGHNPEFQALVGQFANAILRRDSGAAITDDERRSYRALFYPVWGDNPATVALKKAQRETIMLTLRLESEGKATALPQDVLDKIQQSLALHKTLGKPSPADNQSQWPQLQAGFRPVGGSGAPAATAATAATAAPLPGGATRSQRPGFYYMPIDPAAGATNLPANDGITLRKKP